MTKPTMPLFDSDVWRPHLAAFAPLPEAFVTHIFRSPRELKPYTHFSPEPYTLFDQTWLHIQRARQIVSHFLVPAVAAQEATGQDRIVSKWFRQNFEVYAGKVKTNTLAPTTVQGWIDRKLLRTNGYSSLEPNSVAGIFMMRYLFKSAYRFWLPRRQKFSDPWFYVWGIRPGGVEPPRVYPYPFTGNAPANMLFYTQWIGASWQPGFVNVPGVGALAWGKTREFAGNWYWDLTEDEMSAWDASYVRDNSVNRRLELICPILKEQQQGFPDAEERYRITRTHALADSLLERIGVPILAGYMQHYFGSDKIPVKPYVPF